MKIFAIAFFLRILHHAAEGREGSSSGILGEFGETVLLPCYGRSANVTPSLTLWLKDGVVSASRNHSAVPGTPVKGHYSILDDGSLNITGLMAIDGGTYQCDSPPQDATVHTPTSVFLQIVSGPDNVTMDIQPATILTNGTHFVRKGSTIYFMCSSKSHPSQNLSWIFEDATSNSDTLASGSGLFLHFNISNIQPTFQGNHSCKAQNSLSKRTVSRSMQLLVYYSPERHPECMWRTGNDSSHVVFSCSWHGGYPLPTLHWHEDEGDAIARQAMVNISGLTESLAVTMNRSMLYDGQTLRCTGHHLALVPKEEKSCSFTLKAPHPKGEPLVTAPESSNVTLTCTESISIPPAKTIWQRTTQHEDIVASSKYIISEQGPIFTLIIVNVSKQDEGVYFCFSENPLAVKEFEVYLTVKSSASYTGIVGTFIAILIVGSGIVVGILAYSSRDRICLGYTFGHTDERSDVLSLVESDEDELFSDTVPRLPTLANGHATTLVQIHRIPSSDHEDQDNADQTEGRQESTAD